MEMGDPSKKCDRNFHQIHRLLTCFEEGASIKRKDRWVIVRTVRELLKSLPTSSSKSLLQGWLKTRQEALISVSIYFLKLIVIASRKVKYVKLAEGTLTEDLKLIHDILGNQGRITAMVALRAGAVITEGQGLLYICQAQVFGTIAREVVKSYLAGVNPDSEEDIWWSILLFRLWLLSCGGETKTVALQEILTLLPRKVSRRILGCSSTKVKSISTKSLLNVPMNKLVKMAPESLLFVDPDIDQPPIDCKSPEIQQEFKALNNILKTTIRQLKAVTTVTSRTGIMKHAKMGKSLLMKDLPEYCVWNTALYSTREWQSSFNASVIPSVLQISSNKNQNSKVLQGSSASRKTNALSSPFRSPQDKENLSQDSVHTSALEGFCSKANIRKQTSKNKTLKENVNFVWKKCKTSANKRLKIHKYHGSHVKSTFHIQKSSSKMSDLSSSQSPVHTENSKMKRRIKGLSCSKYEDGTEIVKKTVGIETQVPKRLRLSQETDIEMKMTGGSNTPQSPKRLRLSSDTEFEISWKSSNPHEAIEVHGNERCDKQKQSAENKMEMSGSNGEDRETAKTSKANGGVEYENDQQACLKVKDMPEEGTHNEINKNERHNVADRETFNADVDLRKVERKLLKGHDEKTIKASLQNDRVVGRSADIDSVQNKNGKINKRSEINDNGNPSKIFKNNIFHSLANSICSKNNYEDYEEHNREELPSVICKITPKDDSYEGNGESKVDNIKCHNTRNVMQSNSLNVRGRETENLKNNLCFINSVNETINNDVEFCGKNGITKNTDSFKTAASNVIKNLANLNQEKDKTLLDSSKNVATEAEKDKCGEDHYSASCLEENGPLSATPNYQKNASKQLQSTNIDENQGLHRSNTCNLSDSNIGTNCHQTNSQATQLSVTCSVPEYDQSTTNNGIANARTSSSAKQMCLANASPVPEFSAKNNQLRIEKKGSLKLMVEQCKSSQHKKRHKRLTPDEVTESSEGGSIQFIKKCTKSHETNATAKNKATRQSKKTNNLSSWKVRDYNKNFKAKKVKSTNPAPGISSTKCKKGFGKLKGIAVEDYLYVPRGWKRVIEPRLTKTIKGLAIKTDVKACSPDGKTLTCPKKFKMYFERALMKMDENLDLHKIYKMSPTTKRKVMEKNSHLAQVVAAERERFQTPGNSRSKAYIPLRLTFKKTADFPIGSKPQANNLNKFSKDGSKNSSININLMSKKPKTLSCKDDSSKFTKEKCKSSEVNTDNILNKDKLKTASGVNHPEPSTRPIINAKFSAVKHKMVADSDYAEVGYDPYIFTEENSDFVDARHIKLLTDSRKSIDITGVGILRNGYKSDFGLMESDNGLNSIEPVINETFSLEKNSSLENAPSIPMSVKSVEGISADNTNRRKSQPSVSDENPQNSVLDTLQNRHGDKDSKVSLSQNQDVTNSETNTLNVAKGAHLLKGNKTRSEELCNVTSIQTLGLSESMKIKEGKTLSVCCEKYGMMTPDNESWNISDTSCITSCTAAYDICKHRVNKQKHVGEASEEFNHKNLDHTPKDNAISVYNRALHQCNMSEVTFNASPKLSIYENDTHTPSVITVLGDTGEKTQLDDLVTPQSQIISQGSCSSSQRSPHLNNQETQTTERINVTEVRVLSKEDGEKFALIPIAPDASREDIWLELRYYKRLPHHTNHSYLVNSHLFTLSPHKRASAALMEDTVLSTRSGLDNSDSSVKKHNGKFLKMQKIKCLRNMNVRKPLCRKSLLKEFFSKARVKQAQGNEDVQIKNSSIKKINRGKHSWKGRELKQDGVLVKELTSSGSVKEYGSRKLADKVAAAVQTCSNDHCIGNNLSKDGSEKDINVSNEDVYDMDCFAAFDTYTSSSNTSELIEDDIITGSICSQGHQILRLKTVQHNPIKSSKLASCLGIYLCQLRATLRVSCRENMCGHSAVESLNSRLCQHHHHNAKRTTQLLLSPTLFEMSCPLCRLTFQDLRPCSYHADILSNARLNGFNPDSPLEALVEKLETEYWEYVGIISSVFPSKTSLALPSPYQSGSTCSIHGVTQDIDLETFCSSQVSECSSVNLGNNQRYLSSPSSRAESHDSGYSAQQAGADI